MCGEKKSLGTWVSLTIASPNPPAGKDIEPASMEIQPILPYLWMSLVSATEGLLKLCDLNGGAVNIT